MPDKLTRFRPSRLSNPGLLLCVFVGAVFVMGSRPLLDPDLWWHLANGRYIIGHGIPTTDVYSFTAAGHSWVVHEWLSDVLMYGAFSLGGIQLLALSAGALLAFAFYMVSKSLRDGGLGTSASVLLGILLMLASTPSWGARPQLLNFVLAVALMGVLAAYKRNPGRWLYWSLIGFLIWANLHSGYLVGVGLLAVFAAGETGKALFQRLPVSATLRPWLVALLALLSGLLTPAGYKTVLFPLGTLSSSAIQSSLAEWSSPDFHSLPGRAFMALLLVLVAGAVAKPGKERPDLTEVLLALAGIVLALTSLRNVPIFVAAAAPLLGRQAAAIIRTARPRYGEPRTPVRTAPKRGYVNSAILASLAALGLFSTALAVSPAAISQAVAAAEPVEATDYLLSHDVPQPLFNFYDYGGYLIWKAYPRYKVFIDGRVEVYGDALFGEYLATNNMSGNWEKALDKYHVRSVLMPQGHPLKQLLVSKGWQKVEDNGKYYIYVRPASPSPGVFQPTASVNGLQDMPAPGSSQK